MKEFAEIKQLFATKNNIDISKIEESTLLTDLGMDSLDLVELIMEIEEKLSIHFEDAELSEIKTVGDVYKLIVLKTR